MLLLACFIFAVGTVTAQTSNVTGTVISEEDGQPVVGASVLVVGTQLGTVTDVNGKFALSGLPKSAKNLQVSYIGMMTETVAIKSNVKVVLKSDSKALEDFNSFKSNKLFAVNMLQEGMNLKGIEVGIIIQLDGQKLRFIQRTGRVLRSDFPVQYILYFKNTRDEEYLVNALEGINEEYVKEFRYEDNN